MKQASLCFTQGCTGMVADVVGGCEGCVLGPAKLGLAAMAASAEAIMEAAAPEAALGAWLASELTPVGTAKVVEACWATKCMAKSNFEHAMQTS